MSWTSEKSMELGEAQEEGRVVARAEAAELNTELDELLAQSQEKLQFTMTELARSEEAASAAQLRATEAEAKAKAKAKAEADRSSWCANTANQMKAQHKMLRVFFHKFDLFAEPGTAPTGAP